MMDDLIYLDNGATAFPKPQVVYDFMHEFYQQHGVNPGRSGYDKALETEEIVISTRRLLTEFFNGKDPERLTFSYNASDSLNQIIQGMVGKGGIVRDKVLQEGIVNDLIAFFSKSGLLVCGTKESPIRGPKGNREVFIYLKSQKKDDRND